MTSCPRCGTRNPPEQAACVACGALLQAPPPAPPAPPVGKQTMLGLGAGSGNVPATWPDAPALRQPQPAAVPNTWPDAPKAPAPGLQQTMLGMPAVAPPAAPAPHPAPPGAAPRSGHQTMLGMAPAPAVGSTAAGAAAPQPATGRTMLGVAPLQPPAQAYAPPAAPGQPPAPASPTAAPPSSVMPSQHKTMLGVARPGIAPLNPGVAKPAPAPPSFAAPYAPPPSVAGTPNANLRPEDLAVLPGQRKHGGLSPIMIVIAAGVLALLVAAVLVAVLWKGTPLSASVALDAQGKEELKLTCDKCKDGTTARLDDASATFSGGHATLAVKQPLEVGDNKLALELVKPGQKSGDRVDLTVPVDYRVRGDLDPLSGDPPSLAVVVEARKDTSIVVDGHALHPDAGGKATWSVDVSHDVTGASPGVAPLERTIPYTITGPDGRAHTGEIKLQLGIVPLVLDAPGDSIVVEKPNFLLAGRTAKGATVSVAGRAIAVDPSGRFAQLMNVSSVGETTVTVRAAAPDRAPRLFPIKVKRVDSLLAEAGRFRANATDSYAALSKDIDAKHGWAVALDGSVVEARVENHTTLALLDVAKGCAQAPCLARVVYGGEMQLGRGARISVFGHVTRAVDGPRSGVKVPEVRASFILAGKAH